MESEQNSPLKNPFPGLRPFESHEAHLFFGRDGQSDQLLEKLHKTRFVAAVGSSGSGKSSLVRAGLLPALYGGITATGSDWRVAIMRPGSDPMGELARALLDLPHLKSDSQHEEIYPAVCETILRRSSSGLIDAANWLKKGGRATFTNLLIIVDQFEELFRYKDEAENRQLEDVAAAFVNLLLAAVEQTDVPIYVLLTMRSEYLGNCAEFLGLPEAINKGQYLIPRMTRSEQRAAIEGPLGVRHAKISQLLVNRLLNDTGDNPKNLPILQHALMRTWEMWSPAEQDIIDLNNYYATGGMTNALSHHGDEVFVSLDNARQQELAQQLFTCLVETDEGGRAVRRPTTLRTICQIIRGDALPQSSQENLSEIAEEVIPVIKAFMDSSVSFLTSPPGTPLDSGHLEKVIDISHERIISGWGMLHKWVSSEAYSARTYRRLAEAATLYDEGKAALYRGRDLKVAAEWQAEFRPSRAWAMRYHSAFDRAADFLRRSQNQRRITIVGISGLLAIMLGTALTGFLYFNRQRNIALSESLAAEANEKLQSDAQAGLQLAVQAVRTYATENAVKALRTSLFEHSTRLVIQPVRDGPRSYGAVSAAFSPNGRFVLTANRDGKAYIWLVNADADEPSQVGIIEPKIGFITSAAFDPAGRKILITGSDKKAVVWNFDQDTGQIGGQSADLSGHTKIVNRGAFSPDGKYAITASSDGTARIWDLTQGSGKQVAVLPHKPTEQDDSKEIWVKSAVFDPLSNSKYILTASWDGTARLWTWDKISGAVQELTVLITQKGGINNAVFSQDGKYIVTAGNDGTAKVLGRNNFKEPFAELSHTGPVLDAAFNPNDSQKIITACADKVARVWKLNLAAKTDKAQQVAESLSAHSDWVTAVSFSPAGGFILTTGYDGTTMIWKGIGQQQKVEKYYDQEQTPPVFSVDFNKDGTQFLTGSSNGNVRVWDVATGQGLQSLPSQAELSGDALEAVFSSDAKTVAVAGKDGSVILWELTNDMAFNMPFNDKQDEDEPVLSVALKPTSGFDSKAGVLVSGGKDGTVRMWLIKSDIIRNGPLMGTVVDRGRGAVNSVALFPDGNRLLVAGSDGVTRLFNLKEVSVREVLSQSAPVRCVDISPDGKSIATAGDDGIIRISRLEGLSILQMTGYEGSTPTQIFRVKFSHNGKYLATAGYDNVVRVWDAGTGKVLASIKEISNDQIFISRQDPTYAVSSPQDSSAIEASRLLNDLAFSPDDRYIITARSDNRPIHIYAWAYFISPDELLKKAETFLIE